MLRSSFMFFQQQPAASTAAAVTVRAMASPFALSAMNGRLFETRLDTYFAGTAAESRSEVAIRRAARFDGLRLQYFDTPASTVTTNTMSSRPFADLSARTPPTNNTAADSAVALATEASATLQLVLEAVAQHAKQAVEFGRVLADTELTQQRLSLLAASIYALDAAAMAVAGAEPGPVRDSDAALLATFVRQVTARRLSEAVSLMNPSCVFVPDAAGALLPPRFRAVQHAHDGFAALRQTLADVDVTADVLKAAVASEGPNPVTATLQGRGRFEEQRAARDFSVAMALKLPGVQLSDDLAAVRTAVATQPPKKLPPAAAQSLHVALSELFGSAATMCRASAAVGLDDVGGYSDVLKAQAFLEDSRQRALSEFTLHRALAGKHGQALVKALDKVKNDLHELVKAPAELPPPEGLKGAKAKEQQQQQQPQQPQE